MQTSIDQVMPCTLLLQVSRMDQQGISKARSEPAFTKGNTILTELGGSKAALPSWEPAREGGLSLIVPRIPQGCTTVHFCKILASPS